MSKAVIQVRNLSKSYNDFLAVDNISFDVERGEIFGLLGPNGAGKTTTLECLEGLREPTNGVLDVAGIDPTRDGRQLRNTIGVQLQAAGMPDSITPKEAMDLFCAYHDVQPNYALYERLGLGEKLNTQFYELSTGNQRRMSLALAVAHNPEILILDEPTAGLDVQSRKVLHDMMREMKANGTTIILATHDMAEAEELSDRVAILLNGKLVTTGTPLEITATGAGLTKISIRTTGNTFLNGYRDLPAVQQQKTLEEYAIYFSTDISKTIPALISLLGESDDELLDLRVERPSLEERFLELTTTGEQQ